MRIRFRDPGWLATVIGGSTALFIAAAIFAIRLSGPTELAVIHTQAWPWSSDGVTVQPTAFNSQFRAGDIVVAMDGVPLATWVSQAVGLPIGGDPGRLGDVVTFRVIRDGAPVVLDVPLVGFPVERFGGAPIGLVVFGAGVLGLAVVLVVRRTRSTALRLLFVGASANAADIVAWELGLQPTDFLLRSPMLIAFGAASLFNIVFWSTIVHILAVYPVRSPLVARHPRIVPLLYIGPMVAFVVLVAMAIAVGGTELDRVDRLAAALATVASAMLVLIIASTVAGYRRTSGVRRRQVRWIAGTLVVAAAATLVLLTVPIVVNGAPIVPRSFISFLVLPVPIAMAVAVVRDRLFQVGLLSKSRERIVAAREEERLKLRRELHDGLAPTLAGVGMKLDVARQRVVDDPAGTATLLDEARADLRSAIGDIRRMARELRPPTLDALGLEGAVREQVAGLTSRDGQGPVIIVDVPEPLPVLPAAVEVAAYRIVVEAVLNVVRHSAAERCEIRLALGADELQVDVIDDGRGVAVGAVGVGTRSMHERAAEVGGEVTIEPGEAGGTRVVARLPIDLAPRPA